LAVKSTEFLPNSGFSETSNWFNYAKVIREFHILITCWD
jgi:hypothetical protein